MKYTLDGNIRPSLARRLRTRLIDKQEWQLWLFALPAILFFLIFHYGPMYGVIIAFKNYSPSRGISASKWVGFTYFARFLKSPMCWALIRNTLILSFYQLIVTFPFPVALALLLNHMRNKRGVKLVQTITYAPHFISLVVMSGMLFLFFSPSSGVINAIITKLGKESIYFMGEERWYRHLFVFSHVWQHTGYNAIIFLAALTAVDPAQYEAATIDGASIWQKIISIDLPAISPTLVTMLLLQVGKMFNVDTQKALLLQTPTNLGVSEIIGTYVYKIGLVNSQFSYSTAINLFQTVVNLVILLSVNYVSKRLTEESLW
jgi:putative aldouronate transport system permease protein